jgi:GT2 family glycosyltransferase
MSRIMVGIPTVHDVAAPFFTSVLGLEYQPEQAYSYNVKTGSLIYSARNQIALDAIEGGFDYLVFLDSDMVLASDTLVKLLKDIEPNGIEFVSGLYFTRHMPVEPVLLSRLEWSQDENGAHDDSEVCRTYLRDDLFEVAGAGMGCCIMRVDMITDITVAFKQGPFDPLPRLSEDYAFCWRARQIGKKLWCDSGIRPGHCGTYIYTEHDWRGEHGI